MSQPLLRLIIQLVMFVVKTGQVKNALKVLIWALKTKKGYDEAMGRLDGNYYDNQVKKATDDYKKKNPENFKCKIRVKGFKEWINRTD